MQTHEYDTVKINFNDHRIMTYEDIEKIVYNVRKNVFTFQIIDKYWAEVEFINGNGKK